MSSLEVLSIVCISFGYYNPHHSEYVLQEHAGVGSGGTRYRSASMNQDHLAIIPRNNR